MSSKHCIKTLPTFNAESTELSSCMCSETEAKPKPLDLMQYLDFLSNSTVLLFQSISKWVTSSTLHNVIPVSQKHICSCTSSI